MNYKRLCPLIISINSLIDSGKVVSIETITKYIDDSSIVEHVTSILDPEKKVNELDYIRKEDNIKIINNEIWKMYYDGGIYNNIENYGIKNNGLNLLILILVCLLGE